MIQTKRYLNRGEYSIRKTVKEFTEGYSKVRLRRRRHS